MKQHSLKIAAAVSVAFGFALTSLPAQSSTIKVSTCQQRNHDHVVVFLNHFVKPANENNIGLKLKYIGGPEITPFRKQGGVMKRGLIDLIFCPTPH